MAKVDATRNYGATVELTGHAFEEALQAALEQAEATGATFVHAFEDLLVIAGQGMIGLEIASRCPNSRRSSCPWEAAGWRQASLSPCAVSSRT